MVVLVKLFQNLHKGNEKSQVPQRFEDPNFPIVEGSRVGSELIAQENSQTSTTSLEQVGVIHYPGGFPLVSGKE